MSNVVNIIANKYHKTNEKNKKHYMYIYMYGKLYFFETFLCYFVKC